jgi:DNA-binding NarL/FixJ family response regulator
VQPFAEGPPMKEIAAVLNLSEKTAEFHQAPYHSGIQS